jgi:hypothetical protein
MLKIKKTPQVLCRSRIPQIVQQGSVFEQVLSVLRPEIETKLGCGKQQKRR